MKLTIINGSPRKNDATGRVLKAMKTCLEKHSDVEVSYYDINQNPIKQCTGCMLCYKTGRCHIKDFATDINRSISESQGVIIGSPTYVSNVSSLLKTYIDRGHFVVEQSLRDKYTLSVVTYEIAGGGSVRRILSNLFAYSGGNLSGSFTLKLNANTDPFSIKNISTQIDKKCDKLYSRIAKKRRKSLLNKLVNYIALYIMIKPSVLSNSSNYSAVIQRWRDLEIIK